MNDKVWCKRSGDAEPFHTHTKNVGAQRFFYEVHELSTDDIAYLEAIICECPNDRQRELNRGWITHLQQTFAIEQQLVGANVDPELADKIQNELEKIRRTVAEEYHTKIEDEAIPILKSLREEDSSFFNQEKKCFTFIFYIALQYFRTAKMRNTMIALPNPCSHDQQRTWPIEAFIYATNLGASIISEVMKYRITFLRNTTNTPLIAGDQPVINLCGAEDAEVDLYYPLKPNLAMILSASDSRHPIDRKHLSLIEVERFNHRIYEKSESQIFGNDGEYLTALSKIPKKLH